MIGAGVFGITAALELARRGHDVTLLDGRGLPNPDASSSDASKVVRLDYGADGLYANLAAEALTGWRAWNGRWVDELFHETGLVLLARADLRPGSFEGDSYEMLRARGHGVERLTPRQRTDRFPAWQGAEYPAGYFNPDGGWVESGRAVARLLDQARDAGVRIRERAPVSGLVESGSRVTGVLLANGERERSEVVVAAAGARTPFLLPWLADVMQATGQAVLRFQPADRQPFEGGLFPVWCADLARSGWYGFPVDRDGLVKVANHGPGRRVSPDDPLEVDADERERIGDFVRRTLPDLRDAPVRAERLCLYCNTFDGDFWIDHDPDRPGLVVAAGGSGHAFKFAPVLGGIVADAVERVPNRHLGRFAWRRPGEPGARREERIR